MCSPSPETLRRPSRPSTAGLPAPEAALIKALREEWIAGAGLDVLEQEPPAGDSPLLTMDNVILSSHVGHYSDASMARRPRRYGSEVARVLTGRMPLNLVNPQVREVLPLKDD